MNPILEKKSVTSLSLPQVGATETVVTVVRDPAHDPL
jgi:hypothetical protein